MLVCDFVCNVYGCAALPISHLKYIWEGYDNFERQINCFRNGTIDLNEYMEALSKYLLRINDVVEDAYTLKKIIRIHFEWEIIQCANCNTPLL